jgi:hypothetical protein
MNAPNEHHAACADVSADGMYEYSCSPKLDQSFGQGQPGQVGAAPGAGLAPDPVQVGADRADADVQPVGDLGDRRGPARRGTTVGRCDRRDLRRRRRPADRPR